MSTLTLLLSSTLALAPNAAPEPQPTESNADADEAAMVGGDEETRYFEFKDDGVEGDVLRDDGTMIPWRRPHRHGSLINLRAHFLRELVVMARDM
ncbi:MAG: hypothetical protein K0V04_30890 [Deltaproteobacteria bacterium]|nr:hypothetical protein [Deltaproteobacteria bacterium]